MKTNWISTISLKLESYLNFIFLMLDADTNSATKNIFSYHNWHFEPSKKSLCEKMTSLHLKSWKRWEKFAHTRIFYLLLHVVVQLQWLSEFYVEASSWIIQNLLRWKFFKLARIFFIKRAKSSSKCGFNVFLCMKSTESEQKTLKFMPLISISWLKASLSLQSR